MNLYIINYWELRNGDEWEFLWETVKSETEEKALTSFRESHRLARTITIKKMRT